METLERKVTAAKGGKILHIRVNNIKLTSAWRDSHYYVGESVFVDIKVEKDKKEYYIRPKDTNIPWSETHWSIS